MNSCILCGGPAHNDQFCAACGPAARQRLDDAITEYSEGRISASTLARIEANLARRPVPVPQPPADTEPFDVAGDTETTDITGLGAVASTDAGRVSIADEQRDRPMSAGSSNSMGGQPPVARAPAPQSVSGPVPPGWARNVSPPAPVPKRGPSPRVIGGVLAAVVAGIVGVATSVGGGSGGGPRENLDRPTVVDRTCSWDNEYGEYRIWATYSDGSIDVEGAC